MSVNLHDITELQSIHVDEKIRLRPLISQDGKAVLTILEKDPEIRNRVSVAESMHTQADFDTMIDTFAHSDWLIRYGILYEEEIVGLISLWRHNGPWGGSPDPDTYGFGYFLDPEMRGKGIIFTCLQTIMNTVEKILHPNAFIAFCEADNPQSIAVLERIGLKNSGEQYAAPNNDEWVEEKYIRTLDV